jgi:5,10-methylenetetrahydromethanopterin reductase
MGGDTLRWKIAKSNPPMLLGTWGFETFKACHNFVSEIKIGGTANPNNIAYYFKKTNEITQSNNNNNKVSIVSGAVCVVDEDSIAAKQLAKKEVALYLPVVADLDKTVNIDQTTKEGIADATKNYDFE